MPFSPPEEFTGPPVAFQNPKQILIAHLSRATEQPPYGFWQTPEDLIPIAQQAAEQQIGNRDETYLDHFIANRVVEQDFKRLAALAEQHQTVLKHDGSPFGTTHYLDFTLGEWQVSFDGFHLLASRDIEPQTPPEIVAPDAQFPKIFETLIPDCSFDHVSSHLVWDWLVPEPADKLFLPGIFYRLADHPVMKPGHAMTFKWAGNQATKYVPIFLAEIISLWLRADSLHMLLQESRSLVLKFSLPDLPQNPSLLQQTEAMQHTQAYWAEIRSTLPQFIQQGQLVQISREFLNAVESFLKYGLSRRYDHHGRFVIYGPYPAEAQEIGQISYYTITLRTKGFEKNLSLEMFGLGFSRLHKAIENVEADRKNYETQAAYIRELISMNTSMLTAHTTLESARVAKDSLKAAWWGIRIAVLVAVATFVAGILIKT